MKSSARTILGAAALTLVLGSIGNAAGPINFDALSIGTVLSNQFAASGVLFTGSFTVDSNTYGGGVIVPSPPNYIFLDATRLTGTLAFKVGGVDAVTDKVTFNLPGLVSSADCYGGAQVQALDIHGNVIASGPVGTLGPNVGAGVGPLTIGPAAGIHSVQFTYFPNTNSCPTGGIFPLDDLNFDALAVPSAPTISKSFNSSAIQIGGTSTLSFTVANPNTSGGTNVTLTGISFTDTLPAGVLVATPNALTGSCGGGTITAVAGSSNITLTAASLAPNASCTFSVSVIGTTGGVKINTTSTVSSNEGGPGAAATATLNVQAPPTLTKTFANPVIFYQLTTSNTTTLSFTVTNPAGNPLAQNGIAFTDTLPAGLFVANPAGVTGSCGGSVTAVPGSNLISLSGGSVAAGGSCTFTVQVVTLGAGPMVNTTSAITASGLTGTTATATTFSSILYSLWWN
jgi:uncharacterized repeat protein (TIGR01451 family)